MKPQPIEDYASPYEILESGITDDGIEYVCYHGRKPYGPYKVYVYMRNQEENYMEWSVKIDHEDMLPVDWFIRPAIDEFRLKFTIFSEEINETTTL